MDTKQVIILTKSKKHGGYCIAGKNLLDPSEWIRIVNPSHKYEQIAKNELCYKGGQEIQVLDIVSVNLEKSNNILQPENWNINPEHSVQKIDRDSVDRISSFEDLEDFIFYDKSKKISHDELESVSKHYSLQLIIAENLYVFYSPEFDRIYCDIVYHNRRYAYIPITDIDFLNKHAERILAQNWRWKLQNVLMVISLGENYDGYHYKLAAQIFVNQVL